MFIEFILLWLAVTLALTYALKLMAIEEVPLENFAIALIALLLHLFVNLIFAPFGIIIFALAVPYALFKRYGLQENGLITAGLLFFFLLLLILAIVNVFVPVFPLFLGM